MRIKFLVFIILLFMGIHQLSCQNRWLKIYHDETDAPLEYIIEGYDHGYLLLGRYGANYPKYMWLIKTDINGEILWEKTIGDGETVIVFTEVAQNTNGDIYLVGSSRYYNDYKDPIIIKLDSCGEKQWCKVYSSPDKHYDFADCIALSDDRGCIVSLNYTGINTWEDRICLLKLAQDGEMIWTQCYNSQDTCLRNEDDFNMIMTPDKGFLITGYADYEDPTHPNLYWLHPFFMKVDSLGNFQWETVVHKEDPMMGGEAWATVISPDSRHYYSSISNYYHEDNTSSPALLKMDMDGNVVDIYDLVLGYEIGKLFRAVFISDSTLAGSVSWRNEDDEPFPKAIIIDTLGNIINERILTNDEYLSYIVRSFDDKLLYFTDIHTDDHFDALLFKFNFNLEDDSIYTYPYVYDSLCPYPIASDTIVQDDCGLIVGATEWPPVEAAKEAEDVLEVFPNPAYGEIHCKYRIQNTELAISLYDIWGRLIESVKIPSGQSQIRIDVSDYPPGVYFVVLKEGKVVLGRKKVVVK